jgi:hypothetical protein
MKAQDPKSDKIGLSDETTTPQNGAGEDTILNPFDPAKYRLTQDFSIGSGVKKLLTHVPVKKPSKETFVRTHPSAEYRLEAGVIELREEGEIYLVDPAIHQYLQDETTFIPMLLMTAISRQNDPFVWPIRLPGPDGRPNPWNQTAFEAAERARDEWVRVVSNRRVGFYQIHVAVIDIPEPEWPDEPFGEILEIAFAGRVIESVDHPVIKSLRGAI